MMLGLILCLVATTALAAKPISINSAVEKQLERLNGYIREKGGLLIPIHPYNFKESNVRHSKGFFVGSDTLRRTDDCTMSTSKSGITLDYHIGFGIMVSVFDNIDFRGQVEAGYFRIDDNSVQITITIAPQTGFGRKKGCKVYLDVLRVERLNNATLHSFQPKNEVLDVSDFYRDTVLPTLNRIIDLQKDHIETLLPGVCNRHSEYSLSHFIESLISTEYFPTNVINKM